MSRLTARARHMIAVGGGKGGVGKSVVSIALATEWARRGRRVVLVDLDLGAANLHTYLGLHRQTPTLARFLRRETDALDTLLVETGQPGLRLVRGADDMPGMANPPHWMKLKLLRHIRAIDADIVVLDLGAGTAFNTLDFFAAATQGVVVTEPQPAAVMNAYGFIKSAFYRRLQNVFRHHPAMGDAVEMDLAAPDEERQFSVPWLREIAKQHAPEAEAVVDEITEAFQPNLIVNRVRSEDDDKLVGNLLRLSRERLGLPIEVAGQLPAVDAMRRFQLDIPAFMRSEAAATFRTPLGRVIRSIEGSWSTPAPPPPDLSEAAQAQLTAMLDDVSPDQLQGRSRDVWKLRVFFRPQDVLALLESQGHPVEAVLSA